MAPLASRPAAAAAIPAGEWWLEAVKAATSPARPGSPASAGGGFSTLAGAGWKRPAARGPAAARGGAVVTLPEWFEALNRDLRYQLTVIGTFAQAIVGDKVKNNRFTIRTSVPNVEVSWQVTGVRSDAAMAKHPFRAEEEKPRTERGTYLDPEAFGRPGERGVAWQRYPQMMQQLKGQGIQSASSERTTTKRVASQE